MYVSDQTQEKSTGRKKTNLILNMAFQLAFASAHFCQNEPKMSEICSPNWRHHLKGSRRCDQSVLVSADGVRHYYSSCLLQSSAFYEDTGKTNFCQVFLGITAKGNDRSLQRNPLWRRVYLWRERDQNIFSRKNIML